MKFSIQQLEQRQLLSTTSISGNLFDDRDNDGRRDSNEPRAEGVVYVDANNDGVRQTSERSAVVSSRGSYIIRNVAAGRAIVRAEASLVFTQRTSGGVVVNVTSGKGHSGRDVALRQVALGTIRGVLFNDSNANGQRDAGENPIRGGRVVADLNRSGTLDVFDQVSTLTQANGSYTIKVPVGQIRVWGDFSTAENSGGQTSGGQTSGGQNSGGQNSGGLINTPIDGLSHTRPGPDGMAVTVVANRVTTRHFGARSTLLDPTTRPVVVGNDAPRAEEYRLTFEDTFDGNALDSTKWSIFEQGPRRDAIITPSAVSVGGGDLTISTFTENGTHFNAIVSTQDTFEQKYGYFEARIKFSSGPGMWSAFWLISEEMREGGNAERNPGRADLFGSEIDIVEHRSQNFFETDINDRVTAVVHVDGYLENHKAMQKDSDAATVSDGYHVYGVDWRETELRFYLDGELWWTVNRAEAERVGVNSNPISGVEQFMLLSSEVQHQSWAGAVPQDGYGPLAQTTTNMKVDYVRVFARV